MLFIQLQPPSLYFGSIHSLSYDDIFLSYHKHTSDLSGPGHNTSRGVLLWLAEGSWLWKGVLHRSGLFRCSAQLLYNDMGSLEALGCFALLHFSIYEPFLSGLCSITLLWETTAEGECYSHWMEILAYNSQRYYYWHFFLVTFKFSSFFFFFSSYQGHGCCWCHWLIFPGIYCFYFHTIHCSHSLLWQFYRSNLHLTRTALSTNWMGLINLYLICKWCRHGLFLWVNQKHGTFKPTCKQVEMHTLSHTHHIWKCVNYYYLNMIMWRCIEMIKVCI